MDWLSSIALKLNDIVSSRRAVVLCLIAISVVIAGAAVVSTPVQTSIMRGLLPSDYEYEQYKTQAETFGVNSDDLIFVAIDEGESIFRADTLDATRQSVAKVEALPEVEHVTTLVNTTALTTPWRSSLPDVIARATLRATLLNGERPTSRSCRCRYFGPSRTRCGPSWTWQA